MVGVALVDAWLRARKVRGAAMLAAAAVPAAESQSARLPGEQLASRLVTPQAEGVIALDERRAYRGKFRCHPAVGVITSMPGIGVLLATEFLAATGGDMTAFGSADRLASFAGVALVPLDSGRVSGNLHRPQRCQPRPATRFLRIGADQHPLQPGIRAHL